MAKHVFIVNTPLHLVITQSIIKAEKLVDCVLIGFESERLKSSPLLEVELWSDVYELPKLNKKLPFNYKKQLYGLKALKNTVVFWGNDYQVENQVIVKLINPQKIFLFDDGIASYIDNIREVSKLKRFAMQVFSTFFLAGALKNYSGIGCYTHHARYCLNEKLSNTSNNKEFRNISLGFPKSVINQVKEELNKQNFAGPVGILLTQPITEYSAMSLTKEDSHLIKLANHADKLRLKTLLIKPHPGESELRKSERLSLIKNNTKATVVEFNSMGEWPIELLADQSISTPFKNVLSVYSTALITLKVLRENLNCTSSLTLSDTHDNEPLAQLYTIFKKIDIQEVSSD